MAEGPILQAREIHAKNIRESSNWIFYYFMVAVGTGFAAATTRSIPFGPLYYIGLPVFVTFFVAPPLLLRNAKHHSLRVTLLLIGLLLLSMLGLGYLGLASAGWLILLTTPIISTVLVGRRAAYFTLSLALFISVLFGVLHSAGYLQSDIDSYGSFFGNWRNWMVMIFSLFFTGLACITLTEHLRKQWEISNIALFAQHDQMRALVEYAPEAILIYDLDLDRFTTINTRAEKILGYSRSELMGSIIPSTISPEFQPDNQNSNKAAAVFIQQALDGQFPIFEWQLKDKSGNLLDCEVSLARLPPFDKRLLRASIVEITARKAQIKEHEKVQEQLAASQKLEAVGKLTGGVAHDFNNLLAVTLGNLELLRDETKDPQHKKLIDRSIAATLRGADLTRNMLAFARKASLEPVQIDINLVVMETKNWIARTLPATISVKTSLLKGLWPVEADPSSTESALLNLIINARDAMPKGGKLTIETNNIQIEDSDIDAQHEDLHPGRYVMLAVSDTGTGIASDTVAQIFEPFFSTKTTGNNSGLGLSMVHGFMRQSNGTVLVYSEPGVGTTFKLFFKVAAGPLLKEVQTTENAIIAPQVQKRILVAEDDSAVLDVIIKTLEKAGYDVTAATSGDAAKEIFVADPHFDLLLTDIVMPGRLLGTSLSAELRVVAPQLPVVFMSGYASEAAVHGNGLRPEDIRLMKPVQRTDLLKAIQKALD